MNYTTTSTRQEMAREYPSQAAISAFLTLLGVFLLPREMNLDDPLFSFVLPAEKQKPPDSFGGID